MKSLFCLIKCKFFLPLFIVSILLFLFPFCIQAAEVTLEWDKPNDNRVVGFNIYCGKSETDFKSTLCATVNSPDTNTCIISNLERGYEYSFTAKSFGGDSNESDFSNIVSTFIKPLNEIDRDGDGYSEVDGDCNDNFASISPNATEICGDGIDQNCDGGDVPCGNVPGANTLIFGDLPGSNYPGTIQDTFININEDVNMASDRLYTYTWPTNMPANAVLIKFDLSLLPKDAQIQSATLNLYQIEAGGDASYDVSVHKIINHNPDLYHSNGYTFNGVDGWTANNNCYKNIPLGQADIAPAEDVNSLDQSPGYKRWDVTNMVQDWVSDSTGNFGLLLNSDAVASADSYRFFAASETNDAGLRPSLEIRYTFDSDEIDNDRDGYSKNNGDCNDDDASIAPDATEICGDGVDQNCDGSDQICPEDIDNDNDGFTENQGDCNDNNISIAPGATEICGDGVDQNCDGSDQICPEDIDNDNDGFTENQGDCNDSNVSIAPDVTDICDDGIDQNCDGKDNICNSESHSMVFGNYPEADFTGTVQDTFININQEVNVASDRLNTYTWPTNMSANAVLMKFDLSQLPAGVQIQSATLSLYQVEAGGDISYDVSVHKIINHNPDLQQSNGYTFNGVDGWTANNNCYGNIPLGQADIAPAEDVSSLDQSLGYKTWDVTNMVQDWVTDLASNFGLLLNSDAVASADSYRFFAASEANDTGLRPSLEIRYTFDSNSMVFGNYPEADVPGTVQDTFININQEVNVASDRLNTYTWPINKSANAVLIKFNLSQLPAGAKIQSATLSLYQVEAGGDTSYDVSVHKIINHNPDLQQSNGYTFNGVDGWTANNNCYKNIPLGQADIAPAENVNSLDQSLGYKTWDVTNMVQDWVTDSASNFGLLLNSDAVASADSYRFFAASETNDADLRPSLEVIYSVEF